MALKDKDREALEDTITDLHFTSSKYLDTEKDIHKKLLEVNIEEALTLIEAIKEDLKDDERLYDYKMHMFLPLQVYNLIKIREKRNQK